MIAGIHKKYVRGTSKKAIVQLVQVFLCHLTAAVIRGISCIGTKVYISTRVIKHNYDKRPAQDYDFLIEHLHTIVKYPDKIYKNKKAKREVYCFVKKVNNVECLCSIEITETDGQEAICEVATFFISGEGYLDRFELLWEWKDGTPSS